MARVRTRRRRRVGMRPLAASATVACLGLLLTACGGTQAQSPPSINTLPTASAAPAADQAVVVTGLSDGVRVTVSPGETGSSPGGGLELVSPIYTLGPTGPLGARATVTIALDHPVPTGTTLVVGSRPSDTGSWSWLPATLTPDQSHARFTTSSFSQFGVLTLDVGSMVATYEDAVHTALTSTVASGSVKPTCQGTKTARQDGYKVTSDKRQTLGWCLGMDQATHVLTVVNHRAYPVQVAHGTAPAIATTSKVDGVWTTWLGILAPGSKDTFLAPGGSATYDADLDPGSTLPFTAESNAKAHSTRALYAAVAALVSQLTGYGTKPPTAEQAFQSLVARPQCAAALGQSSAALQAGCLAPPRLTKVLGEGVNLLDPVLTSPAIKTFWARQLAFLAQQDTDTDSQHLVVSLKSVDLGDLVGTFTGHTRSLTVSKTGLVTERLDDGVTPVIELTYQLSSPKV
ncbi:MAG: hypothetical protein JOZ82_09110, partial [Marmoricola sp.]|nr:hypothetical protein [Marmoricola sp.]